MHPSHLGRGVFCGIMKRKLFSLRMPTKTKNNLTRKLKIGVMGSASGPTLYKKDNEAKCERVGRAIAKNNCMTITGACPGLPHFAAKGAKEAGGFVLGVSPAFSEHEHVREYKSPNEYYDIIIFSALGFMERDIMNIRSSDGVVFLGGGIGTMNEFTVAFEEGKPIGILTNSGGLSDYFLEFIGKADRSVTPNIVTDDDPEKLIEKLIKVIHLYPTPIHEDGRVVDVKFGKARG
ncbi:hypothetical protein COW46_00175 [Candidatus Gracilibacteria bacterium CG17_big_fil_post_rev_8_21_14_2_50_48_13]|nr:MAG: hypothetical protein COW46_00175 [Candidatus Gracilibacteria bacterium CG17_big_fil_post_rev_8_21_14_2_50_48_13]